MKTTRRWEPSRKKALALRSYGEAANFIMDYRTRNRGKLPWGKTFENIKSRCGNSKDIKYKYYGGRGIKNFLTREDLKFLFFRDAAWKMKAPSIDRIDADGNYTLENSRWIEFEENRRRRTYRLKKKPPRKPKRRYLLGYGWWP